MKFYRKKKFWFIAIVVLIVGGVMFGGDNSQADNYEYTELARADIERNVSVTGVVHPVDFVDASFEQSGRVARVLVKTGDSVYKGQLLAVLANGDIYADIAQAQARVEAEEARATQLAAAAHAAEIKLDELLNGSRPEEIAIREAALSTAAVDYEKTVSDTSNVLQDAIFDIDYAIDATVGSLFFGQQHASFDLAYETCDPQLSTDVAWARFKIGEFVDAWQADAAYTNFYSEIDASSALSDALIQVSEVENFLLKLSQTLSDDCTRANITFDGYRTSVDTALTSIKSVRDAILAQRQAITVSRNTMQKADADYQLALAGPRVEVIAAQESVVAQADAQYDQQLANIKSAQASVSRLYARAGKTVIRSPLSGTILKRDVTVGEIVMAQNPIMRIATDGAYKIETYIPEVDIAEVILGQQAFVTLDAYDDDVIFEARVEDVEKAETFVDGVPTYQTTLLFLDEDDRIQSGMTANVDIIVDRRKEVIVTPIRSVISKDGKKYIRTFTDETVVEHEVVVGLKGSDGNIELIEFELSDDEEIILFEK